MQFPLFILVMFAFFFAGMRHTEFVIASSAIAIAVSIMSISPRDS
jgi:hypothetical protein